MKTVIFAHHLISLIGRVNYLMPSAMKGIPIRYAMIGLTMFIFHMSTATIYASGNLQYDGVYACYDNEGDLPNTQYYRFYPDGTVIDVASTGSLAQIQPWFNKESAGEFGRGEITELKGDKLSFYTRQNGKLFQFTGEIDGDLIHIKEARWLWGKDTIKFVRFTGPNNIPSCR